MTSTADRRLKAARNLVLATLRGRIDRYAGAEVDRFVARLLTVKDRKMRALALVRRMARMDAHLSFAIVEGLVMRAARRNPQAQDVLLDLTTTRPLVIALGYQPVRRIYELATRRGRVEVARMLLSPESPAMREVHSSFLAKQNDAMPDISLGWRKAHARATDRLKLDRLMRDKNPQVIRLLLDNPRIVERDVVRIAAMRPTNPENLVEVFRHPRWVRQYRIKVALACNPYCPIDIALSCVPQLMLPHLRYICSNGKIAASVREAAEQLLAIRRQPVEQNEELPVHHVSEHGTIVRELDGDLQEVHIDLDEIAAELDDWTAG